MSRYTYDFHIHSCLSPCADNDMTPSNIAGMATLAGIGIMALTDHNTVKNCPAFFKAAKLNGIIPILDRWFQISDRYCGLSKYAINPVNPNSTIVRRGILLDVVEIQQSPHLTIAVGWGGHIDGFERDVIIQLHIK